ncbi:MAG: hypothetical protein AB7E55_35115, partial [Pigmentiphaga sp.]
MAPKGGYLALLDHCNLLGMADRVQPVRDHNNRPTPGQSAERIPHCHFVFGNQRGRCFVQNDDGLAAEDRAGDGHPLTLTAGQVPPAIT